MDIFRARQIPQFVCGRNSIIFGRPGSPAYTQVPVERYEQVQLNVDEPFNEPIAFCLVKAEIDKDFLETHNVVGIALQA